MRVIRYGILAVVILATVISIGYFGKRIRPMAARIHPMAQKRSIPEASIPTARVTRGSLSVTLAANGTLESAVETPVRSEITGNLIELPENNTPVVPGDVVFRLDTKEFQDKYDELARALADATEGVNTEQADGESRITQVKGDLTTAQESFDLAQAKAKAELEKIKAQINFAEGELARAESELTRAKRLAALNYIAGTKLRDAEETYRKKQFELEQQRSKLADAEKRTTEQLTDQQHALDLARLALDSAKANMEEDLEDARTRVADAQRKLKVAETTIEQCTVTAPIAGLAVIGTNTDNWPERRPYRLGDQVGSRAAPVMIYDLKQMQVRCQIGEMDIARVKAGQEVFVSPSTRSVQRYRGEVAIVEELAREANVWQGGTPGKRIFGVLVKLKETDPDNLRPGMTVDLEIVLDRVQDATMVPIRAVFKEGERSVVYRERGETFEPVSVTPGTRNDLLIAVTGDLREGDLVSLERVQVKSPKQAETPRKNLPGTKRDSVVVSTTAKKQDLLFTVTQTGVVAALKSIPVVPEISGRIQWICENGIKVSQGDTIMRLDTRQAREDLANLEARFEETKRRKQRVSDVGDARMKQGRLRLTRTKDDVAAYERQSEVTLQQAQQLLDFHAQELEQRRKEVEVKRRLADKGLLAAAEVEREEAGLKAAEFSLQKERSNYELQKSQTETEISKRRKEVNDATRDVSRTRMWTSRDVRMIGNEVDNLQLQIDRARTDLTKMTLTSPASGLIMLSMRGGRQGNSQPPMMGDWISQGREVAAIVGLNRLQVKLELDQSQITGIKMGQEAEVTIDALPGVVLKGKVTAIGQTARRPSVQGWMGVSAFATFPVTIDLPSEGSARVRPGMRAGVNIQVRKLTGVTLVPTECIVTYNGKPTVFVEREGAYRRVKVELGDSNGEYTVVTRGLAVGEHIALNDLGKSAMEKAPAKESKP